MGNDNKRGLMIGRFQPFHKGHLSLASQIYNQCSEIIIAIGSAQHNYMKQNPFTAGERITMIHSALRDSNFDLSRCFLIPLQNDVNNARWFGHVKSMVPEFHYIYTGNPFVSSLVSKDVSVKKPDFLLKQKYNGTRIRQLISCGRKWQDQVPTRVADIITRIDGINRIKMLYTTDTNPLRW